MERQFSYVTNRMLQNKTGQEKGRLKAFVKTGETTANVEYTCPECGHSSSMQQEFVRPFSVKCSKCGFLMKVPKLKDEIKKDKARAKKELEASVA
jgi:predicted RNA-binding Zn-ribbon protein involved in translation (DUF1610 family)